MLGISGKEYLEIDRPVQRLVMGEWRMREFSFDPTWIRTLLTKLAGLRGVVATLGLMLFALTSPSHAQAPPLGTAAGFGVLAGSTVTNALTSSSVITGNLGVFPAGGTPPTAIMTGVDLGGKTLVPGIYFFASDAFLTGTVPLTLNGQGNPNSLFIFNITSA